MQIIKLTKSFIAIAISLLIACFIAPNISIVEATTITWTTKSSMPTARNGIGAATVDGKIYIIGGQKATGDTGAVEEYNPATDTWTTKTSMPTPRSG